MNILFVCTMNQWRSPTAEKLCSRREGVNARSRGTSQKAKKTVRAEDLKWADVIFVMEHKHQRRLKASFPRDAEHKRIQVLDIPDEYQFMDPELVELMNDLLDDLLIEIVTEHGNASTGSEGPPE